MDYNIKLWRQYREDNPGINAFLEQEVSANYILRREFDFSNHHQLAFFLIALRNGCANGFYPEYREIYQYLITNLHFTGPLVANCEFLFGNNLGLIGDIFLHHGQTLAIYSNDGAQVEYHDIVHLIINLQPHAPQTYCIFNCLRNLVSIGASFDTLFNGQYPYDRLTPYQHVNLRPFRPSWSINNHHYYTDDVDACQTILTVIMCCHYRTLLPIEIVEIILRYTLIKTDCDTLLLQ